MAVSKNNFEIENAKEWNDGNITFNLVIDTCITIYNCKIVNGKKGDFIAFPSYKGKNGKYYSHAYVNLSERDSDDIIKNCRKYADKQ